MAPFSVLTMMRTFGRRVRCFVMHSMSVFTAVENLGHSMLFHVGGTMIEYDLTTRGECFLCRS